jgi:hypothetical protein
LSGFYFIRDKKDSGKKRNSLHLPSGKYEKAYAIQDRMFKANGELFYPAYEGEPGYDNSITRTGAMWSPSKPTVLMEFFGDFMMVNGKAWPRQSVTNRQYRLRLLNGCDSRFLAIGFVAVKAGATSIEKGTPVPFTLVGADQGLLDEPISNVTRSVIEVGARLDIVIDFKKFHGKRIIMLNKGGDVTFLDIPGVQMYNFTSMVMAFDLTKRRRLSNRKKPKWNMPQGNNEPASVTRRVGLFYGMDSYGRMQILQGGEMESNVIESLTYSDPITKTPKLGVTEEWEIYNFSEMTVRFLCGLFGNQLSAYFEYSLFFHVYLVVVLFSPFQHPIHLHLVNFQVVRHHNIIFDSMAIPMGEMGGMKMGERKAMTIGDMGNMNMDEKKDVTMGDMGKMTTDEMGNMTTGEMGNMTTGEMGNMTTGEMGNMTTGEMGNMTMGEMGNMTTGETGNMTTGGAGNMTTGEMGNMTTGEMGNMTAGEMGNMTMKMIKLCKSGRGTQDGSLMVVWAKGTKPCFLQIRLICIIHRTKWR